MKQGCRFLTAPVPLAILIVFSAVLPALPGCDKKSGDEEAQGPAGDGRVGELIVLKGRDTVFRGDRAITVSRRYFLEPEDRVRTGPKAKVRLIYFAPRQGSAFIATRETEFVVRDLGARINKDSPLRLLGGGIRSRLVCFSRRRPYLETATALIGVKGTDFIALVKKKNASEFIGVEGLIEAVSRSLPDESIRIGGRRLGEIVAGEKPNSPVPLPAGMTTWVSAS